jgi:uncharacterized membrane protein YgcG
LSQYGDILTVRALREGEEWMRLNPRHDEQRWAVLNSQIAVLAGSKLNTDKMMLEQLESLVQPTQFLEYLRKTMPMSEDQLDMITTMHDTMMQRLNALEVLHKGGQRAVDEFMSSSLTGMEKLKSAAISKAKRSSENFNGPARKQNRRGGGRGGGGDGGVVGGSASGGGQSHGGNQNSGGPRPSGIQCKKCKRFGHKTVDCKSQGS